MWVEAVRLVDARAIRHCDVALPPADDDRLELPGVTLLLGGHGVGKTTLLRAIAAATTLARDLPVPGLTDDPGSWRRIGGDDDTRVDVVLGSPDPTGHHDTVRLGFTIGRREPATLQHRSSGDLDDVLVMGYGADRTGVGTDGSATPPGVRPGPVDSLLGGTVLGPPDLDDLRRVVADDTGRRLVERLLPPDTGLADGPTRDQPMFTSRGLPAPWSALSDGVRSYLSWLLDVVVRLWEATGGHHVQAHPAVVLVDELDQRMHPDWQQSVLDRLATTLPAVQLVATAHSPLMAAGLRPDNLLLLEPDVDGPDGLGGGMVVERLREDLYGATADTTLTSAYFQLTSPRTVGFQRVLRGLADRAAESDEAALDFVRALRGTNPDPDRRPTRDRPEHLRRRRP